MGKIAPFGFLNVQGPPPPPPMFAYWQITGNTTKVLNLSNDSVSNFSTAYVSGRYNCMQSPTAGYYETGWVTGGGVPQGTSGKTHSRFVFANQTETLIGTNPYSFDLKHGTVSTTGYGYIFSNNGNGGTSRGQTINYSNNTTNVIGNNIPSGATAYPDNSRMPYTSNSTNSKKAYPGWNNGSPIRVDVNNGSATFITGGFTLVSISQPDYLVISTMAINLANESRRWAQPQNKIGQNTKIIFANNTENAWAADGFPSDGLTYRMTAYTSYAAWMGIDGATNGRELSKWNLSTSTNFSLISSPFDSAQQLSSIIQDSDVE